MYTYGQSAKGRFTIEILDTLPGFGEYDIGRFIFVRDVNRCYLGHLTSWYPISGNSFIPLTFLDLGPLSNQINSYNIPLCENSILDVKKFPTIQSALEGLSSGELLNPGCILNEHYSQNSISSDKLKLGVRDNYLGAQCIPYQHAVTKRQVYISDILDDLILFDQQILTINIGINDWAYNPDTQLFHKHIVYNKSKLPIIQCYTEDNHIFVPDDIYYDSTLSRLVVCLKVKKALKVIILGP